jgi:hypothetical protein
VGDCVVYIAIGVLLVCLGAGAVLLDRGKRRAAWWSFGIAGFLLLNLVACLLVVSLAVF